MPGAGTCHEDAETGGRGHISFRVPSSLRPQSSLCICASLPHTPNGGISVIGNNRRRPDVWDFLQLG